MKDSPYQIGLPLRLVRSSGNANDLFKAVRKAHPDAKKNDIVLLAFGLMIARSRTVQVAARRLRAVAMENRGSDH